MQRVVESQTLNKNINGVNEEKIDSPREKVQDPAVKANDFLQEYCHVINYFVT